MNEQAAVTWLEAEELHSEASKRFRHAEVILDVGAGIKPQSYLTPRVHLCLEPHPTYVRRLVELSVDNPGLVPLFATWEKGMATIPDKSVDSVFALDFIEHLEKNDGHRFLAEAIRAARQQVIVFTPLGLYQQDYSESSGEIDRWGLDGASWQCHRSGWLPEDFGAGWELLGCRNYYHLDQYDKAMETPIGAIWAIYSSAEGSPDDRRFLPSLLRWMDRGYWKLRTRIRNFQ